VGGDIGPDLVDDLLPEGGVIGLDVGSDLHAEDNDLGDALESSFVVVAHDFYVSEPGGVGATLPGGEDELSVLPFLALHFCQ
jgi:hypothetical protein